MFRVFASDSILFRTDVNNNVPNITGIIYVNNSVAVDEVDIRNNLQNKFPNLTFFFANVNPSYTAKFILIERDAENGETLNEDNSKYILIGS
jgi:hypothetical protein